MGVYKIETCSYCGENNQVLRPSPFMADYKAMMCKYCWDNTQKEYLASHGESIPNFDDNKEEYNNIKSQANDNRIKFKEQINAMYEHGYTIEDIADNLSDDDCVQSFRSCPDWCGEDSDCYDCWTKCLEMELVNVDE